MANCPICDRPAKEHTKKEFFKCIDEMQERRLERDADMAWNRL